MKLDSTLKATLAKIAWGRNYSLAFGTWMKESGFGFMRPSDRSYALGAFGIDTLVKEGARKIICDDWLDQKHIIPNGWLDA